MGATLIPEISFTDFKKLTVEELKRLKCCEITFNGEYIFTFIRPQTEYIRAQAEHMGELSNSVGGQSLGEILLPKALEATEPRPVKKLASSIKKAEREKRKKRKLRRERLKEKHGS